MGTTDKTNGGKHDGKLEGNRTPSNPQEGYYVGLMNACGYRTRTWKSPSSASSILLRTSTRGTAPSKELVGYVKRRACGRPAVRRRSSMPAPCDGMAQGEGIHFILPSRDLIAGSIEAMVSAHGFDGLVFLCSCDKIVPGMLMAAAALNKPCMFLTAGSMLPYEADEGTYVTPDLKESIGQRNIDAISEETFPDSVRTSASPAAPARCTAPPTPWAYSPRSSACVPSTARPCSSARPPSTSRRATSASASSRSRRRGALFRHRHRGEPQERPAPRRRDRRLDERPAPHLRARARDGAFRWTSRRFDGSSATCPCVAKFKPSSKFNMYDYYKAGGVGATMKAIERYLDPDARLATGGTVGEFLARFRRRVDPEIIHTADEPLYPRRLLRRAARQPCPPAAAS